MWSIIISLSGQISFILFIISNRLLILVNVSLSCAISLPKHMQDGFHMRLASTSLPKIKIKNLLAAL
jgi:hypothetical protein